MVSRHTVTLANSIVGVSVLAMPFCFKQCGIVLATLSLMIGAIMTRMVCYFLLKAAVMSRRRTYEMLAWSTFGQTGKFMVEISIIGFLIGTLIAFMVVIGDLGPEILSEIFSVENNSSLRTIIMTALSLFVALPLGLLRNIDSLSSVSTASVLFYLFLVLKIFSEGIGPLWSGEYLERIYFWKSGGVLQCIPIFSMALSCQTQVFGIYDALPEPSLQKMNEIVKQAVNICTFFYFCVGFFGYIAFSQHNFGGNILMSFSPAWSTQFIKCSFLMSVVFSVPLVVFPCRASLHSMIFKSGSTYHQVHDMSTNYIPESRLKFLTVTIVGVTLIIGILIPNIELVLGLVGSTTGSVICIIFPSIMFVRVTSKNTTERLLAQGMFCIGVVLMLLTTYATLYAAEQTQVNEKISDPLRVTDNILSMKPNGRHDDVQLNSPLSKIDEAKIEPPNQATFERKTPESGKKEPPKKVGGPKLEMQRSSSTLPPPPPPQPSKQKISETKKLPLTDTEVKKPSPISSDNTLTGGSNQAKEDTDALPKKDPVIQKEEKLLPDKQSELPSKDNIITGKEVPNADAKKEFVDKQVAEDFLKKLEEHQENQKKLLEEQKEILEELKQHHAQDVREKIEKEKHATKDNNDLQSISNDNGDGKGKQADINQNISPAAEEKADKLMQEQEQIIKKISQNIEKEHKNVEMLEKLEEGLNKKLDATKADENKQPEPVQENEKVNQPKEQKLQPQTHDHDRQNGENQKPKQVAEILQLANQSNLNKEKSTLTGSVGPHVRSADTPKNDEKLPLDSNVLNTAKDKEMPVKKHVEPEKVVPDLSNKNVGSKDTEQTQHKVHDVNVPGPKKPVSENPPKEKVDRGEI